MKLVQLPNGDWIDPSEITMLVASDTTELTGGGFIGPRVIIHHRTNGARWCEVATFSAACKLRDSPAFAQIAAVSSDAK